MHLILDLSTRLLCELILSETSLLLFDSPSFACRQPSFESHFTELKFGLISGESGTTDSLLRWDIDGITQWSTPLKPCNWHNLFVLLFPPFYVLASCQFLSSAYDIDFNASTVGLWASNGSMELTRMVAPVTANPSTNSADWYVDQCHVTFIVTRRCRSHVVWDL
jgi:hypothetical protein